MKTAKTRKYYALIALITLGLLTVNLVSAQEFKLNDNASTLKVLGTSNLHDWHLQGEQKSGEITFEDLGKCAIKTCDFKVKSEALLSGKKAMDKNTFKALKTDEYKNITFNLVKVDNVLEKGANKYLVKGHGDLTITGVTQRIPIEFNVDINQGKIILEGTKKIKMTDYNVDPPTALFGAITTGDELTIEFKNIYQ
ncbi:YceI family protein [Gaetbulibacter aestuarii]|uniref:YceI family protein n=1 Tax=Gaetbulibacter aestuarii TaxID=1502358 RepID=A0ABW7N2J3_9FLAO